LGKNDRKGREFDIKETRNGQGGRVGLGVRKKCGCRGKKETGELGGHAGDVEKILTGQEGGEKRATEWGGLGSVTAGRLGPLERGDPGSKLRGGTGTDRVEVFYSWGKGKVPPKNREISMGMGSVF